MICIPCPICVATAIAAAIGIKKIIKRKKTNS